MMMMSTNTATATATANQKGFIVAQVGGPVYGFGTTEAEALDMARKWASELSEARPFIHDRMVIGAMFIAPATKALLDLVEEIGGAVHYRVVDGVACLPEEEDQN